MLEVRIAGFVVAAALFWLTYYDFKDKLRREPRRLLLAAFALGAGSAFLALGAYRLAERLGVPELGALDAGGLFLYTVALVGPVEEGAKFLVARAFVFRWRHFDEPIDGLVYASAVAIGFASLENFLLLPYLEWPMQLARALSSPLTHTLFAAVWGFGVGRAYFTATTRAGRVAWQGLSLAAAMVLHGLYDWVLLAYDATVVSSLIALALWIALIVGARRMVARRRPRRAMGPAA